MKKNTEEQLKKIAQTIHPRPELLTRILATMDATVTTEPADRLLIRSRSAASERRVISNNSFPSFMTSMWKIGIPVAALVLVLAGAFFWGSGMNNVADENNRQYADDASGEADKLVAQLFADADAENAAFAEESGDAALVTNDSAELNSVSNSYETREF